MKMRSPSERHFLKTCPICDSQRLHYAFSKHGYRIVRCEDCRLMLINHQPSDAELAEIYDAAYFLGDDTPAGRAQVAAMKRATARGYLRELMRYRGREGGNLLEIGCGQGELLGEAHARGYSITGVEVSPSAVEQARARIGEHGTIICGEIANAGLTLGAFDVCVLSDVIEHVRDPLTFLALIRALLKPDGVLFIATPTLDAWSARLLRKNWMEFKPEHLFYFDANTLQHALFRAGFHQVIVQPGWKVLNLGYIAHHFERFTVPGVTPLVQLAARLVPRVWRERDFPVIASGMLAFARPARLTGRRKLSVIVPCYNEATTVELMLTALLRKELADLDLEIVIVESGSTDGTRASVERYADHPRVRIVWQERARGKGNAVRAGLEHATGEFILIQDADLEYDLDDYDALLEPLTHHREAFVLGARHGGSAWKMRRFADQVALSTLLNAGHWFFTFLVNALFGLRLRDPFTMFKVFRRDCLYGLTFECNRFDFDYELLIKLARKGYRPVEIPVNYRSRSFREGKKVSALRDPLTWLWVLARLRLATLDPLREIERGRQTREQK